MNAFTMPTCKVEVALKLITEAAEGLKVSGIPEAQIFGIMWCLNDTEENLKHALHDLNIMEEE